MAKITWKSKSDFEVEKAQQEIEQLKNQLAETDYQIIKCSEYQLARLELPYDIETLHVERQALRDKINELEQILVADSDNKVH